MRVGGILLGSAALHGAVVMAVVRWSSPAPRVAAPAVEITLEPPPTIAVVEQMPIDLDLVELGGGHDERAAPPSHAGRVAIASTRAGDRETGGPAPAAEHSPGSAMFHHMRGPELRPDDGVMQAIAETGAAPHDPVVRSGRIESAPNGTAIVHDRVATVHIERDGTAHLEHKRDIDVEWRFPIHVDVVQDVKDFGKLVSAWYADPYAGTRYGRTQDLPEHLQAEPGQCDTWGDAMCDDINAPEVERHARESGGGGGLPFLGGKLDITSYLARKLHVGDVYSARKLKLLDDTRDERAARGADDRARQLARSAELMRTTLAQVWAHITDPTERRAALFELWDDCAEGDGELGEAGQRARTQVIGWIRGHLPESAPDAYTADELATLNLHRSSNQAFDPY